VNPARAASNEFLRRSPQTLLAVSLVLSLLDFVTLYAAAKAEGVLRIHGGIGLLENYGLLSSIFSNSFLLYLARRYYDALYSVRTSKAVQSDVPLAKSLSDLDAMIRMERAYGLLIYLLVAMGAVLWVSNVSFHVFGNPEVRWGHKVFDSTDHPMTFVASRLHNFYTWLVLLPFVGHAIIVTSIQMRVAVGVGARQGVFRYDLLNPDQKGGFLFVEKAHVAFNVIIALFYVDITMHIGTFERMNTEHIIAYAAATVLLIGGSRIFLGGVHSAIKTLKLKSLNDVKDKVYKNDGLSFEILKYCYERRINELWVVTFATKGGAILLSAALKLWPFFSKEVM
jgi:hypothetical protein